MPRTRPHDDAAELAMALRLLVRRIRAEVSSESPELSWTQMAVMKRLDTGGPATTADLARAEFVKPQSMGAIVTALEERGIVVRRAHPTDRRQIHIALTRKGARMRKDVHLAKQKWLERAIEKLDPAEQQNLAAVTGLIKRLAES